MEVPQPIHQSAAFFNEQFDRLYRLYRSKVGYHKPMRIVGYLGYGTEDQVNLKGRVLADPVVESKLDDTGLENFFNMLQRYRTDEVPGAKVSVEFEGEQIEVET